MTIDNNSKKTWSAPSIADLDSKFSETGAKSAMATVETTVIINNTPQISIAANS